MNQEKLKHWALLLEAALRKYKSQSKDIEALAEYEPLVAAIEAAKAESINSPIELPGMSHWYFETNIQGKKDLTEALVAFDLLLKGWPLPSETCSPHVK